MLASWVTYYLRPGLREAFCRKANETGIYQKCQKDAEMYEYMYPWDGSDRIMIMERWKDDAQLQAHCEADHVKRELQELKKGMVVSNGCVGCHIKTLYPIDTD